MSAEIQTAEERRLLRRARLRWRGWHVTCSHCQPRSAGAAPLDVERLITLIEAEGVVQWGDEGHRKRFLALLAEGTDR